MPTVASKLKGKKLPPKRDPAWKGPEQDGITFSLLSKFLTCRERFRVMTIEGWRPARRFSHQVEYGNMWHVCEEEHAAGRPWESKLVEYARKIMSVYPLDQERIDHWYNVCKVQFPVYVGYWSKNDEVRDRTPLLQEQVFDVPYRLPSGRTVRLRGKWDSVDLIGKGKTAGIFVQENKTKGDIDLERIQRQVSYDLQTMMYLIALKVRQEGGSNIPCVVGKETLIRDNPILGVRYNVVRRPLSGGEGSIVQRKGSKNVAPESKEEFYARLRGVIDGTGKKTNGETYEGPGYWFHRWTARVLPDDVARFREKTLDPILEQLCCWYDEVSGRPVPQLPHTHNWIHPFGVTNSIDEYGYSDLDEYLLSGSTVGLERVEELFPELKEQ